MKNRILLLGTAGTLNQWSSGVRSAAGILISTNNTHLLLDPGPGSLERLRQTNIPPSKLSALLITQAHLLKAHDTDAFLAATTHTPKKEKPTVIANQTFIKNWATKPALLPINKEQANTLTATPKKNITLNQTIIQPLPSFSPDKESVSYKLITPNFVLTYSGETGYRSSLLQDYKGSDILILNLSHPPTTKKRTGLNTHEIIKILQATKPKLCILTGFGDAVLRANPLYEARKIKKETNIQVIAATDGLELEPMSYSANAKQKRIDLL